MIEPRHLRVLRAVAATGSFSAAARELGCTQPAVSQQMKALEQSSGTPLLVRTGREMRLTQAGEALVRHAAGILAGLTAAEEEVAAIAGLRAGRVRLVSFPSGSSTLVPTALAELRESFPGTRVSLVEAEPPRSVEMLRAGDCEIAVAFRYPEVQRAAGVEPAAGAGAAAGVGAGAAVDAEVPGAPAEGTAEGSWGKDDLVVRPLLSDRLVGVVPEGHRLAGAGAVGIGELAGEPWIAGCPRCRRHLVDVCEAAGFTPRIDFATDDYPAVIGLVAAGLGVAVLPELALESVRAKGTATVEVEPAVRREVVALTLPDLARVPAVAATLDRLESAARREPRP
ncbi:LysR family transcriptional regulator [Streptomyces sparsogenes]|uniref:LysR family transcriptional regulator n=1 Tax=Streptomyces sparsogenes TaxID=67365 RepID=UPI0034048A4A